MKYLFTYLYILFAQSQNGLTFALPASIVYWHKVHSFDFAEKFTMLIMALTIITRECTSELKKKGKREKFSNSFYFLFFINLRNNILHEYNYGGRYFGLYKKINKKNMKQFEEKK